MQVWTFLHILSMFSAVTVIVGAELLAISAIRRRDREMLRVYFRIGTRADILGMALFLLGIGFGVVAAMTLGWSLLAGWLVIAYVLAILTVVVGFSSTPYLERLKAALGDGTDTPPGPDLEALLDSRRLPLTSAASIGLTVLLIADMVFKPAF
jgi:uncharacterized membrane protein